MPPDPYFHPDSESVRFWVTIEKLPVGASVGQRVLHYSFRAGCTDGDPLQTYRAHAQTLADAVRRRVAAGAIEPVMLRESDLAPIRRG